VEGLIHISEMSWVRHIKHPSDLFNSGDKISAKILNIDADEKKISMGIKQLQDNPWDNIESKYKIGSDHDGIVRNLTQFGAFVELEEGIDGLVHVSDMSWTMLVRHPKEMVNKGDKVKIRILEVSTEDRRLSLGMKQIEGNPWEEIRKKFSSGKVIKGEILKILDKGIIFKIEDGLEGIVPIKRLSKDEKQKILSTFKEGDTHEITVQEVDAESKKIILMMDLELGGDEKDEPEIRKTTENDPEKIEIPQDIIDQISDNDNTNEESGSADTKEVDN
jgi:small subunit ribosomal protein S1